MYRPFHQAARVLGICAVSVVLLGGCENKNKNEKAAETTETKTVTQEEQPMMKNVVAEIKTNLGTITVALDAEKAPMTVENFKTYADESFYDQTIFHRVIPGFMIQGGGFTTDFVQKLTRDPIKNEADNGLKNKRGTIAMARTADPDSASSQFFINLADNDFLDHRSATPQGWGYAVFGHVVNGMDVVDNIAKQKTGTREGHNDVPMENVVIESIKVTEESAAQPVAQEAQAIAE